MYGVILWSDTADSKAVIWCEDQGDLAYYQGSETGALDGESFDAGDLVQFDLHEDRHIRLASNPRLVSQNYSTGLADELKTATTEKPAPQHDKVESEPSNVIQFKPRKRNQSAYGLSLVTA